MNKIIILLLLTCYLFSGCQKDPVDMPEEKPQVTSDLTGIEVKTGMTLVGIVTNSGTGQPMEGVVVSDGYTTTVTDVKGTYQMARHKDARFVFCSIPANCEVEVKNSLPVFFGDIYSYYDIFRKDFQLKSLRDGIENRFTLFCVADPQIKNMTNYSRCESETMIDIRREAESLPICYGVTLGDIVYDAPDLMDPMKRLIAYSPVKFFHTIGNHDHYQEKSNDAEARANFENCFGPVNYSFNRGNAHIVVMDNVVYTGNGEYSAGFSDGQITWLKSDLSHVSKDKLIILCVHIPLRNQSSVSRLSDVYGALKPYKEVHVMSGHTHYHQNFIMTDPSIYEHIHGAACGTWWTGTVNGDGAPNGYGVFEIEGNHIKNWYYKSTQYPKEYQARIYAPYSFGDIAGYVIANVWNADPGWKVELYENGIKTGDMLQFTDYDKCVYQYFKSLGKAEPDTPDGTTTWYRRPDHLYRLKPVNSSSTLAVRITDRFGNIYTQEKSTITYDELKNY